MLFWFFEAKKKGQRADEQRLMFDLSIVLVVGTETIDHQNGLFVPSDMTREEKLWKSVSSAYYWRGCCCCFNSHNHSNYYPDRLKCQTSPNKKHLVLSMFFLFLYLLNGLFTQSAKANEVCALCSPILIRLLFCRFQTHTHRQKCWLFLFVRSQFIYWNLIESSFLLLLFASAAVSFDPKHV